MITRTEIKNFRSDFAHAVERLQTQYGVKITLGNISYSDLEFHTRLTVTKLEASSPDNRQKEFAQICRLYDLKPEDYGRNVVFNGQTFTIAGINPKAPKNCIELTDPAGRRYKTTLENVKRYLKG